MAAATTSKTKDYLGRAIVTNHDYLGREVKAGDLDFLGRALLT